MKLKDGFVLKEIAGECVVISSNFDLNLDGMITLNSTAKTLWLALEKGVEGVDELTKTLLAVYEVEEDCARGAAERFLARMKELDFIE